MDFSSSVHGILEAALNPTMAAEANRALEGAIAAQPMQVLYALLQVGPNGGMRIGRVSEPCLMQIFTSGAVASGVRALAGMLSRLPSPQFKSCGGAG